LGDEYSEVPRQTFGHDADRKQGVDQVIVGSGCLPFLIHSSFLQSGDVSFILSSLPTGKMEGYRTKGGKNYALRQISPAEGEVV